jgi:hypothetical protein
MQGKEEIWVINDEGGRVMLELTPALRKLTMMEAQGPICAHFLENVASITPSTHHLKNVKQPALSTNSHQAMG